MGRIPRLTRSQARRIALGGQGFTDPRPSGRIDVRHFRRVMSRIALVQLDSVNVVARAHYLPFFSRLGPYPIEALDRWLWRSGEGFEYWGHEASVMPIAQRPLLLHRMDGLHPWGRVRRIIEEHPGYVEAVLDEVRRRGPLTVGELSDPGERTGPWWGYGKGKTALEWLFAAGAVTVADRPKFVRLYEVPERVFPEEVLSLPSPSPDRAKRELLALGARAHGLGTAHDLADYYRLNIGEARRLLPDLVTSGVLTEVEVEGWRHPAYLHREASIPRRVESRALLGPFDPLVWRRERVERLFGFRYRIEIYVPADKRIHGYYVLPFLLGDELVARVDLKADRARGRLLVRSAFVEDGRARDRVAVELGRELASMAEWQGLGEVEVEPRGDLAGPLARAMRG